MPLPTFPILCAAGVALYLTKIGLSPKRVTVEEAHDDLQEGASLTRSKNEDGEQLNGDYRYRRVIQFGRYGPSYEIDATALMRIKLRRV